MSQNNHKILLKSKLSFALYSGLAVAWLSLCICLIAVTAEANTLPLKKQFFEVAPLRAPKVVMTIPRMGPMSLSSYQDRHNAKPIPLRGMSRPLVNNADPKEQQLAMLISPESALRREADKEDSERPKDEKRERRGSGFAKRLGKDAHAWPVEDGIATRISSHFGFRKDPFTGKRAFHAGIDIPAPVGTGVLASADGVVDTVASHARLGKYVKIKHDDETYTLYGHLKDTQVKAGQKVKAGKQIGRIGSTGRSTGPHLDFSIRKDGKPVNPIKYLEMPAALTASVN